MIFKSNYELLIIGLFWQARIIGICKCIYKNFIFSTIAGKCTCYVNSNFDHYANTKLIKFVKRSTARFVQGICCTICLYSYFQSFLESVDADDSSASIILWCSSFYFLPEISCRTAHIIIRARKKIMPIIANRMPIESGFSSKIEINKT